MSHRTLSPAKPYATVYRELTQPPLLRPPDLYHLVSRCLLHARNCATGSPCGFSVISYKPSKVETILPFCRWEVDSEGPEIPDGISIPEEVLLFSWTAFLMPSPELSRRIAASYGIKHKHGCKQEREASHKCPPCLWGWDPGPTVLRGHLYS